MKFLAILNLDKCATPKMLVPLYWALIVVVCFNAAAFFMAAQDWTMYLVVALGLILGLVSVRIFCELLLVPFKILSALEAQKGE